MGKPVGSEKITKSEPTDSPVGAQKKRLPALYRQPQQGIGGL
jgi:hypothetical protein